MDKCYYAYCRPKLPNHPWSLEKIPFNRSIISDSASEIKGGKSIKFNSKELDEIGISVSNEGNVTLPIGKYIIEFSSLVEVPVASDISIKINSHLISSSANAGTPINIYGRFIEDIKDDKSNSLSIINGMKDTMKLRDSLIIISKI